MEDIKISQLSELDEEFKVKAIKIFVDGFYKVFSFSKDKEILQELFLNALDCSMIYVAIYEDEVVGFVGIGNNKKRTAKLDKNVCTRLLGKAKGYIVYIQLTNILEKPKVKGEKDLYIDYLTTDSRHRAKGIGARLINFVCCELGFEDSYIEVFDKNKNAKNLYEKLGFIEYKRIRNPFLILQGLGVFIEMKRKR